MECSFTALDAYFGAAPAPLKFERFEGDLVGLAKTTEGLSFPGLPYADAVNDESDDVRKGGSPRARFQCTEGEAATAFVQLRLTRGDKRHYDARGGVYEALGQKAPEPGAAPPELVLFEAAALAARYDYAPKLGTPPRPPRGLPPTYQRDLLELILTGKGPAKGFELLSASGFLADYWPEVAGLIGVTHSKDYHPEGDAWRHTMETFSYRKAPDLVLSLALLLHDTGKPDAVASGSNRFDGHSELGERAARCFLERLGYPRPAIDDVAYLVRYHMLPAALPRLPPSSIRGVLDHELFPVLLELYRCDELSTFRGPDGYYEACAAYKAYLKNSRNPYRGPDGKRKGSQPRPN